MHGQCQSRHVLASTCRACHAASKDSTTCAKQPTQVPCQRRFAIRWHANCLQLPSFWILIGTQIAGYFFHSGF